MTMSSDSFINLSKVKSKLPSFTLRQATQGSRSLFRTSSNVRAAGSTESFCVTEPPPATPQTINVVLFGETGVGKSSVINLIARKEVAKVSSDVNGCTMQSTRHDISFDDMNFAIFDTIGLEEPQMGVNGYLKAIEKAYELITKLGAAGGIHLLLFCMRGGRITATTQSNYRLFCECLCGTKVPIALVFTGLERETEMEDWWTRNRTHIEGYGIKSAGHACITAVQDDTPGEDLKYTESQNRIRELLKNCALRHEAFLPEPHTWFAKFGRGLKSFIEKHKNPKRRDVMKVLTNRCKLDQETARKIADMMEKSEPETKDDSGGGGVGNTEGRSNPEAEVDGKDEMDVAKENDSNGDAPPDQQGDVKAESQIRGMEETDERRGAKKNVAKDHAPPNQLDDVKAEPPVEEVERKGEMKAVKNAEKDHTPPNQPGAAKAEFRAEGMERRATKEAVKDHTPPNQLSDIKAEPRTYATGGKDEREVARRNVMKDRAPSNQPGDVEPEPRTRATERRDERDVAKQNVVKDRAPSNQPGDVKPEPRTHATERRDERDVAKQNVMKDRAPSNQPGDVKPEPRAHATERRHDRDVAKKIGEKDHAPSNQPGDVRSEPCIYATEETNGRRVARKDTAKEKDGVPSNQYGDGEAESRIDGGQIKFGNGGGHSEGTKPGDFKKWIAPPVSSRSRQFVGSQS